MKLEVSLLVLLLFRKPAVWWWYRRLFNLGTRHTNDQRI